MKSPAALPWIEHLRENLPLYLGRLSRPGQFGAFYPCERGMTEIGRAAGLGFSCFALKIYYTAGLWHDLSDRDKRRWVSYIQSFQKGRVLIGDSTGDGAFVDPPVASYVRRNLPFYQQLIQCLITPPAFTDLRKLLFAETKQALATLAQVGMQSHRPYRGFPRTGKQVKRLLEHLDWTRPWNAGGQASCLAVFLALQAPLLYDKQTCRVLQQAWSSVIDDLADKTSGGYFKGNTPAHSDLVSGAMKILTGLDWLCLPIHYPEALVDTCLQALPPAEACHIVNTVYVLFRCLQQTPYKKDKVQSYCQAIIRLIRNFYNNDGGFSYWIGKSQMHYYNVPISSGLAQSDIHGTCLLTWALAMLFRIMDESNVAWNIIKP